MNLDTYDRPDDLYLARGAQVNPSRPLFTGDVFRNVEIPGVQPTGGMALVVAHPCSFRVGGGQLADRLLAARVEPIAKQGAIAWRSRFFDRMPLTGLDGDGYWAGHLDMIGRPLTADLSEAERIACLSEFGVNMLQQRLTCHLTRAEIPTATFNEAFSHTFEEADLLEDFTDTLVAAGWIKTMAATEFESFLRAGDPPTLQAKLLDAQQRSSVRRACRQRAAQLVRPRSPSLRGPTHPEVRPRPDLFAAPAGGPGGSVGPGRTARARLGHAAPAPK